MPVRRTIVRSAFGGLLAVAAFAAFPMQPASAQGLFEMLFGGLRRASQEMHLPSRTTSFADPFGQGGERRSSGDHGGGGGQAYCVRTCDGRFFPLQRSSSASPAELCKSFCPASKTMVFYGSKIDHASSGSTRYADLDNAFLYRERLVENCTCNGKDAFGLARVDVAEDPTLKPGDIVATADGLATYRGKDRSKEAQFTPINPSAGEWARRLAETKVMPVAAVEKVVPVAEATPAPRQPRGNRSAQNVR